MDFLSLKNFLSKKITAKDLIESEKESVLKYINNAYSKGSSAIHVAHEEFFDGYTRDDVKRLLMSYLNEEILEWDLDFIANCLDMLEEDVFDETARQVIFNLSNPEIGIPIDKQNVLKLVNYLNEKGDLKEISEKKKFNPKEYRSILLAK